MHLSTKHLYTPSLLPRPTTILFSIYSHIPFTVLWVQVSEVEACVWTCVGELLLASTMGMTSLSSIETKCHTYLPSSTCLLHSPYRHEWKNFSSVSSSHLPYTVLRFWLLGVYWKNWNYDSITGWHEVKGSKHLGTLCRLLGEPWH